MNFSRGAIFLILLLLGAGILAAVLLQPRPETVPVPPGAHPKAGPDQISPDSGQESPPAEKPQTPPPIHKEGEVPEKDPEPAREGGVWGRVVDSAGQALAGATVGLFTYETEYVTVESLHHAFEALRGGAPEFRWTQCHDDGSFDLGPRKGEGQSLLLVTMEGYADGLARVAAPGAGRGEFLVVLHKGHTITGRVIDADTGEGVAGIPVEARQMRNDHTDLQIAASGTDGNFTIDRLRPWGAQLRARPRLSEGSYGTEGDTEVQGTPRGDEVVLKVRKLGHVVFAAVDSTNGRAIDGSLTAEPVAMPGDGPGANVAMEAPGRFVISSVAGTRWYTLTAPGFLPVSNSFTFEAWERSDSGVVLKLRPGTWIEGTVTLADPRASPRFPSLTVFLEKADHDESRIRRISVKKLREGAWTFRTPALESGLYRIVAAARGCMPQTVEVQVGRTAVPCVIDLSPRTAGAPPPRARFAYEQRKDVRIGLNLTDVPLEEVVEWLVAATGADIRIREGTKLTLDESYIQLHVDDIPLGETMNLLLHLKGLEIDEATGEIYRP